MKQEPSEIIESLAKQIAYDKAPYDMNADIFSKSHYKDFLIEAILQYLDEKES